MEKSTKLQKDVEENTAPKPLCAIIDDGTREIALKNQFGALICKIHIRPADYSIVDRYDDFVSSFSKITSPLAGLDIARDGTVAFDREWEVLKSVEAEIKARFNALFDMDEADAIFEKRHAFSSVGGKFFCERVLTALGNAIVEAVNAEIEQVKARTAKYLTPEENTDAGSASDKP